MPMPMPGEPLISIVVPVSGVRRYLPACLDSILSEPAVGIEVIAVDDASADGSGQLLDERASSDPRLRAIHLDQPGGPGKARNTGLDAAAGQYVWFADGDDLLAQGALTAIAGQLTADQPDVLLIGYRELSDDGSARDGYGRELLRTAPAGIFTLADQPALINLTMTAWSKVLRREFLAGLGVRFPAGIHEDIPVTCAALLAGRLAVLDRTCYQYRRRRPGSFLVSPGDGHLSVFESYGQVFGLLERLQASGDPVATAAVGAAVFERAIWHYAAVFGARARPGPLGWRRRLVPGRQRRAFFARMHAEFVTRRPAGYRLPPGTRGAKLRMIERGSYRTWCLAEPVNQLRVAARDAIAARRTGHRHDPVDFGSNSAPKST